MEKIPQLLVCQLIVSLFYGCIKKPDSKDRLNPAKQRLHAQSLLPPSFVLTGFGCGAIKVGSFQFLLPAHCIADHHSSTSLVDHAQPGDRVAIADHPSIGVGAWVYSLTIDKVVFHPRWQSTQSAQMDPLMDRQSLFGPPYPSDTAILHVTSPTPAIPIVQISSQTPTSGEQLVMASFEVDQGRYLVAQRNVQVTATEVQVAEEIVDEKLALLVNQKSKELEEHDLNQGKKSTEPERLQEAKKFADEYLLMMPEEEIQDEVLRELAKNARRLGHTRFELSYKRDLAKSLAKKWQSLKTNMFLAVSLENNAHLSRSALFRKDPTNAKNLQLIGLGSHHSHQAYFSRMDGELGEFIQDQIKQRPQSTSPMTRGPIIAVCREPQTKRTMTLFTTYQEGKAENFSNFRRDAKMTLEGSIVESKVENNKFKFELIGGRFSNDPEDFTAGTVAVEFMRRQSNQWDLHMTPEIEGVQIPKLDCDFQSDWGQDPVAH